MTMSLFRRLPVKLRTKDSVRHIRIVRKNPRSHGSTKSAPPALDVLNGLAAYAKPIDAILHGEPEASPPFSKGMDSSFTALGPADGRFRLVHATERGTSVAELQPDRGILLRNASYSLRMWRDWTKRLKAKKGQMSDQDIAAAVAEILSRELSRQAVNNWLNGVREPGFQEFIALCAALNADPAEMLFGQKLAGPLLVAEKKSAASTRIVDPRTKAQSQKAQAFKRSRQKLRRPVLRA
jgi:transcriptional regulator with XRE-family HTH domain